MKNLLSILIITVLLTNTASADQGKGKRGPDIDKIVSTLQLDVDTSTNLKALMEKHQETRKAAREEGKKDRAAKKAARKQYRADLLAVLGYEKMYEFEDIMRQNRKSKGKGKKRNNEQ